MTTTTILTDLQADLKLLEEMLEEENGLLDILSNIEKKYIHERKSEAMHKYAKVRIERAISILKSRIKKAEQKGLTVGEWDYIGDVEQDGYEHEIKNIKDKLSYFTLHSDTGADSSVPREKPLDTSHGDEVKSPTSTAGSTARNSESKPVCEKHGEPMENGSVIT